MLFKNKIILCYHGIGIEDRFTCVSEALFKKQIEFLLRKGYVFLSIHQLLETKQNGISLVFDDGLSSVKAISNFLIDRNIPFGISLIANKINGSEKYLNSDEILKFKNCEFYSHGYSHSDFTKLDISNVRNELIVSKKIIEDKLKRNINVFVYPFGKYNNIILNEVHNAGYKLGLSLLPFHVSNHNNKLILPRMCVNGNMSFSKFKFLVSYFGNIYLHTAFIKRKLFGQNYLTE